MNPHEQRVHDEYLRLKSKPILDVCMFQAELDGAVLPSRLARLVYEEKMMEEQDRLNKEQIDLQHRLNKENIELQHDLNKQVVDKQIKVTIICTIVTATATLLAALAGAYLAYALTQVQKPIQIKETEKQTIQLQTAPSSAATGAGTTTDKVPSLTPLEK